MRRGEFTEGWKVADDAFGIDVGHERRVRVQRCHDQPSRPPEVSITALNLAGRLRRAS